MMEYRLVRQTIGAFALAALATGASVDPLDSKAQEAAMCANPRPVVQDVEQRTEEPALFVVSLNGKKGFINEKGTIVIAPRFESAYPFSDGLAAVQVGGKWGYIDASGRAAIEPRFTSVAMFSDGLAAVRKNSFFEPWGYIDKSGRMVIEPRFDCADDFRNGVARVGFETPKSKVISKIADVGIECSFRFIDRKGNFVEQQPPEYFASGDPEELIRFTKEGLVGYVDSQGKVVIEPQFSAGSEFSEGLAYASRKGLFGYIDRTGTFVIPEQFEYANDFSGGLAGVSLGDKGWGFIDRSGKTVIAPQFAWVHGKFRHGIVEVTLDRKNGYIDQSGDWVWKPSQ